MQLRSISLNHVRSYDLRTFDFNDNVTLILGRNGTGKTSVLEAIYVLLRGTSFRGRDRDIIAHGANRSIIKLVTDEGERRVQLTLAEDKIQKQFKIDGTTSARLNQKFRRPVVMFEPDELRLLSSSPQRRRQFIDGVLERLSPGYGTALHRYARVLLQRNELLKQRESMNQTDWDNHLFAWDIKFSELAGVIVSYRRNLVERSNQHLSELYSIMAGADHRISVEYSNSTPQAQYSQTILKKLQANRVGDSYRGYTSAGPHRDDIVISLDDHPASSTASRGEMRTIMLAYKQLEVALQEETSGQRPLILMDDVFSELDAIREQRLMDSLKNYQTIITATDLRDELKIDATTINL
jgi:DNA replication and repair protein RecF